MILSVILKRSVKIANFILSAIFCLYLLPTAQAASGDLDTSFGNGGKVVTPGGGANATAIQPDGKIIVAGVAGIGAEPAFAVARYNADGSLDTNFGVGGIRKTSFGGNGSIAHAVAIQADGKIIAAGYMSNGATADSALARYNTDGSLDTSFDGDGRVVTAVSTDDIFNAVVIQTDGKIVAVGYAKRATNDFSLVRYNADGSLDGNFGTGGIVFTDISLYDDALAAVIQTDGKIVAAGAANPSVNGDYDFALARYNTNGSLDTTFHTDGIAITAFSTNDETAWSVAIQTNGKIVAAGKASNGTDSDFALARYNTDGSLDNSFDTDGKATTPIGNADDFANAVAVQANGKIVVAGTAYIRGLRDFALVVYKTDGSLDTSFGEGGKVLTNLTVSDIARGIAIQTDGKIVVAGGTWFDKASGGNFGLARYLQTRPSPFDFDGDNKTDISIFRPSVGEWWYLKSSNGGNAAAQFGAGTDPITPGDFTGDGKTDIAFWRPSNGFWFVLRSEDYSFYSFPFGTTGDIPAPGDFDGDGKTDATVFRPSTSTWFISRSSDGGATIQQFGQNGDVPVVADYDGDGKSDIAIYRVAVGEWWIQRTTAGTIAFQFGNSSDKPVQGDYTGDGSADVAIWRPSTGEWFVLRSEDQSYYSFPFGTNGDSPAPGDFDGDGKFDATVFRPSSSTWYVRRTTAGILIQTFGIAGDRAVSNAFVR